MFEFEEFQAEALKLDLDASVKLDDATVTILSRGDTPVLHVHHQPESDTYLFESLLDCPEIEVRKGRKMVPSDKWEVPMHAATCAAGICAQNRIKVPQPEPQPVPVEAPEAPMMSSFSSEDDVG